MQLPTSETDLDDSSFQEDLEDSADNLPRSRQDHRWIRIAAISLLILCITLAVVDSLTDRRVEKASISFLEWVAVHPFLGLLGVILAYTVATICFVPGSILTLGTGFAFRSASGSFVQGVALATTVSQLFTFCFW